MSKRGFTLVEVAIVLCLITILSTALLGLLRTTFRHTAQASREADQFEESRRVAWRVFSLSRQGSQVLPDQSGVRLGPHGLLQCRQGWLTLAGRPVLTQKLRDFAVVRRENRLHLLFEFEHGRYQFSQPDGESL